MFGAVGALLISSLWIMQGDRALARENIPPKIEAFLKHCETTRRGSILELEHTLRGLRRQSPQSAEVVRRIKEAQTNLETLQANEHPVVGTLAFPPQAGAIGRLPRRMCHVDQIVSEREMLVRCFFRVKVAAVRKFKAHGETVVPPVGFSVRGVATRDFHEGADVELPQVFEIGGRHTYETVGGSSNTVWVLNVFDMEEAERYFRDSRSSQGTER
jgi:hypothetical protein